MDRAPRPRKVLEMANAGPEAYAPLIAELAQLAGRLEAAPEVRLHYRSCEPSFTERKSSPSSYSALYRPPGPSVSTI